jgi:hypothetical protein
LALKFWDWAGVRVRDWAGVRVRAGARVGAMARVRVRVRGTCCWRSWCSRPWAAVTSAQS